MSETIYSRNNFSRRHFLKLLGGGLGTVALAGPLTRFNVWRQQENPFTPEAPPQYGGPVIIWGYTGTLDPYSKAVDRLVGEHPDLQITTQDFPYLQAHANILNVLLSGIGVPDLVNFDVDYVGDFADGMLDLSDRFAPYADNYVPIAVQLAKTPDGRLTGLPQDNEPMGFCYRADIFEQYGITEDDLATWDGFVEAGKKLWTDSGQTIKMISMDAPGSQLPLGGAPHQIHEVFLHLAGYHGVFFNRADDKVIIDEPDAIAAIEAFKKICDPDVAYTAQTQDASIAAYKAGLVASQIYPAWYLLGLVGNLPDLSGKWRVMRLPALTEGGLRAAFQIPTITGIPQLAANPDGAWGVLYEVQLTAEAQWDFYIATNGILPTHKAVVAILEDTSVDYFGGQKSYKLLGEILADIDDVWFGRGWVEARAILTSGIEPIMRGEISVADGLHNSAEEMRRRLNKG
jgi:lactose/L-arabinose transport system substrate-binding protein